MARPAAGGDHDAPLRAGAQEGSPPPAAVALTAFASVDDQRQALAEGYDAFVTKPADAEELVAAVTRLARARKPADGRASDA